MNMAAHAADWGVDIVLCDHVGDGPMCCERDGPDGVIAKVASVEFRQHARSQGALGRGYHLRDQWVMRRGGDGDVPTCVDLDQLVARPFSGQ